MKLKSLQLVNFRNYKKLHLEFNGKVNLLVGKNGQGKTNIVESIYMLSLENHLGLTKIKKWLDLIVKTYILEEVFQNIINIV